MGKTSKSTSQQAFRGTFSACLTHLQQLHGHGPFLEIFTRPDTGGASPGVLCMSGPTDYIDIEHIPWSLHEYQDRRHRTHPHMEVATTTEAMAIVAAWGYDPNSALWELG